jgi:hypothetical protein
VKVIIVGFMSGISGLPCKFWGCIHMDLIAEAIEFENLLLPVISNMLGLLGFQQHSFSVLKLKID